MSSFTARELTGTQIGKRIRFMKVDTNSKVETIITGELLTIAHASDHVRVELGSKFSSNSTVCERLDPLQNVETDPPHSAVENIQALRPNVR